MTPQEHARLGALHFTQAVVAAMHQAEQRGDPLRMQPMSELLVEPVLPAVEGRKHKGRMLLSTILDAMEAHGLAERPTQHNQRWRLTSAGRQRILEA